MTEQERFDLMRDEIIDLKNEINRLQAENEKWQGGYMTQKQEIANLEVELKAMRGAANSYKAENERLKNAYKRVAWERDMVTEQNEYNCKLAKAKAYKEFWKELYVEMRMYGQQEKFTKSVFLSVADKVLKEMVGEDNG
jgi:uncharacterized protein YukE